MGANTLLQVVCDGECDAGARTYSQAVNHNRMRRVTRNQLLHIMGTRTCSQAVNHNMMRCVTRNFMLHMMVTRTCSQAVM